MPDMLTMLVSLGIEEAPEIINLIHSKGGTVQAVGQQLDADQVLIDADIARLKGELDPPKP